MKRVLITGENSYIGTSVAKWLEKSPDEFEVTTISVRGEEWKKYDFSQYDTVFHVAGIAHADTGKVSEAQKSMYYKINCDLAFDVAEKFKEENTGRKVQFIYMSSIIVYGDHVRVGKKRVITKETVPNPSNFYGDSKLQAEIRLAELKSVDFLLAIIRPPMIYGPGSKGNYPMLAKIAKVIPAFPDIQNQRSMLYIDNLSESVKLVVSTSYGGVFFPQNKEYVQTRELVKQISMQNNKTIYITPLLNWIVRLLSLFPGKIGKLTNKAFGNIVYDKALSLESINNYQHITLFQSVELTEKKISRDNS